MLTSQARRFGDALVDRHVVTRDAMEAALEVSARTGQPLPDVFANSGQVPEADMAAAWAAALGVIYVDFASEVIEPDAVAAVPESVGRRNRAAPVAVDDNRILVAFESPLDANAVQDVAKHVQEAGLELVVGLAEFEGIDAALSAAYSTEMVVHGAEPSGELYRLFERVLELKGSDLHLAAGHAPYVRLVGELVPMPGEVAMSAAHVRELVYSILSLRQQQRFEETCELDTSHAMGTKVRFRVNVFLQRNAVGAAFRVIPFEVVDFDELGLPPIVRTFADYPRGLVLVTGPTGSGKSTTLASLIDIVNQQRKCHIVTIEDPIEFVHQSKTALINQREVGSDTDGFSVALTSAMRQDPDVILVGEMRDLETISTAITAAETGHLVFATLHTQDAPSTVDRMIDAFPGDQQGQVRVQLANSLMAVVTQQLVPTVDGLGRVVASEVMVATTPIRALIRDGKAHQIQNAMMSGRRQGMVSMDESLMDLVKRGVVSAEAAMHRAHNPDDIARAAGLPVAAR